MCSKTPETKHRKVLDDFTKRAIDEVLPVRAARKSAAVDVMMRVDRLAFSRPVDRDPSIAMMQLVPIEPLSHAALVQGVGAHQKKMKKTWVRLARRKLKSQKMITAMKKLMSGPGADRMTVDYLRVDVGHDDRCGFQRHCKAEHVCVLPQASPNAC